MRGLMLVARREIGAYVNSYSGYVIVGVVLVLQGLLFNAFALGSSPKLSSDVLEGFFEFSFGCTVVAALLLTMRLIAEERQTGTMSLLDGSPLRDWQVVGGKYLGAMSLIAGMLVLSSYMPLLVMVNGKVSLGHVLAGYTGVLLAGSAAVAIGTFGSSLSRSQVLAAIISGAIVVVFILAWLLGRVTDAPLDDIWSYSSLFDRHFQPFMRGRVNTEDIIYYVSMTFVFLLLSTRIISARRWR